MIKKEIKMNKNKEKSFLLIHNYLTIEAENFKEKVQAKKFEFLFIFKYFLAHFVCICTYRQIGKNHGIFLYQEKTSVFRYLCMIYPKIGN